MQTTNNNDVSYNVDANGVATLTLNNPEKHNAFDDNIIAQLTDKLTSIATDNEIRVVVLAANGKSFCAGADLSWMKRMAQYSYEENLADANKLANLFHILDTLPQPTIAKVQGAAFGGAVGLASCCDIVIASERASFCLSEVKLGLIPATIAPYVIKAIGERASRRYFITAERFNAITAKELGLVSEVTSIESLDKTVNDTISALMQNSPQAIMQAKSLVRDIAHKAISPTLRSQTSEKIAAIRVSDEGQEGLNAFFEKRTPHWIKSPTSKGQS